MIRIVFPLFYKRIIWDQWCSRVKIWHRSHVWQMNKAYQRISSRWEVYICSRASPSYRLMRLLRVVESESKDMWRLPFFIYQISHIKCILKFLRKINSMKFNDTKSHLKHLITRIQTESSTSDSKWTEKVTKTGHCFAFALETRIKFIEHNKMAR